MTEPEQSAEYVAVPHDAEGCEVPFCEACWDSILGECELHIEDAE